MVNTKIVIIVVVLAAAVVITLKYSFGDEAVPQSNKNMSDWLCSKCEHHFQMTPAEETQASRDAGQGWPPAKCTGCGEKQAYRAQICGECGFPYFGMGVPGGTGACPRCHPEIKPPDEPEIDKYPESDEGRTPVRAI